MHTAITVAGAVWIVPMHTRCALSIRICDNLPNGMQRWDLCLRLHIKRCSYHRRTWMACASAPYAQSQGRKLHQLPLCS